MTQRKVNVRSITIEPYNAGDLVAEITRAYLHRGNPSALLKRIIQGVREFRADLDAEHETHRADDDRLAGDLMAQLDEVAQYLASKEDTLGGKT